MTFVTTGVHRVAGEASLEPVKATLQGPSRVIQRELPNVACRHIDVEPIAHAFASVSAPASLPASAPVPAPASAPAATADWRRARLVQQLARELRSPIVETAIAYRGADRWIQHYVRAPLTAVAPVAPVASVAPMPTVVARERSAMTPTPARRRCLTTRRCGTRDNDVVLRVRVWAVDRASPPLGGG
jgi:hypothetical protein